jgi:hypothetical protein
MRLATFAHASAHERQDGGLHVADQLRVQRFHPLFVARRKPPREPRVEVVVHLLKLRARRLERHAGLHAADGAEEDAVTRRRIVRARRDVDVRRPLDAEARRHEQLEPRRRDSRDERAPAADGDQRADHVAIAAVAPPPELVAEDRDIGRWGWRRSGVAGGAHGRRLADAVRLGEIAARRNGTAQHGEEVRRDERGANLVRRAVIVHERDAKREKARDPRELAHVQLHVSQVAGREREITHVPLGEIGGDQRQLARVAVRQRPQQHRIDDAEDCGRRADAEGERHERGERERRALAQRANAEGEVFQPGVHKVLPDPESYPDPESSAAEGLAAIRASNVPPNRARKSRWNQRLDNRTSNAPVRIRDVASQFRTQALTRCALPTSIGASSFTRFRRSQVCSSSR